MRERSAYSQLTQGESVLRSEIHEEGPVAERNVDILMREGEVVGQYMLPLDGQQGEVVLFQTNRQRHQDNLQRLHGTFYKGTYYHNGVGQPHSNGRKK